MEFLKSIAKTTTIRNVEAHSVFPGQVLPVLQAEGSFPHLHGWRTNMFDMFVLRFQEKINIPARV